MCTRSHTEEMPFSAGTGKDEEVGRHIAGVDSLDKSLPIVLNLFGAHPSGSIYSMDALPQVHKDVSVRLLTLISFIIETMKPPKRSSLGDR